MITCRMCVQALHPYLDRELSEEDVVQVKLHLDSCGGCLHAFRFQETLMRVVRVRCQEQQAPHTLKERVLLRLYQEREKRARTPAEF